jgi:hypothetical protein
MAYRPDPNNNLSALALLTSAADKLAYFTGAGSAAVADLTSVARSLLAASTEAAMRIVLGVNREYIYVTADGNGDYATVQAAIDAASSGDVVQLGIGDYPENVTGKAGVELWGERSGKSRITGADTTSTRLTLPTSAVVRNIGVVGPSSGSNPAVTTPSSGTCLVQFCGFSGNGGTGPVLEAQGSATLRMVATSMGGTAGSGLKQDTTGDVITRDCALTGTFTGASLDVTAGSDQCIHTNMRTFPGHSAAVGFQISAAANLQMAACYFNEGCTVGMKFNTGCDGVTLVQNGGSVRGSSYDLETAAGLTGTGTRWYASGLSLRQEATLQAAGGGWASTADITTLTLDEGLQDVPKITVEGQFSTGRPLVGAASNFGRGAPTTLGMRVFSATGANSDTTDGSSFVDNTDAAKSADGSTFSFWQGTAIHNAAYIGSSSPTRTFPGIEVDVTTALALGSGEIVAEYWNGSAYTPFQADAPLAVLVSYSPAGDEPFTRANSPFQSVEEQGLQWESPSDWATKEVNGVTAYWMRFRVGTLAYSGSSITTVPVLEHVLLETDHSALGESGFLRHFGQAEPQRSFWISQPASLQSPSGGANAPANANITFSSNVAYQSTKSSWDTGERAGAMVQVPEGLDTSRPVTLKITWYPTNTDTGNVDWNLYVDEVLEGGVVGSLTEQQVTQVIAAPGTANQVVVTEFEFLATSLTPGDFLAFMLWREAASDTFTGSAVVLTLDLYGRFWK